MVPGVPKLYAISLLIGNFAVEPVERLCYNESPNANCLTAASPIASPDNTAPSTRG